MPGWALVEIVCLWVSIAATIAAFSKVSGKAALLYGTVLVVDEFRNLIELLDLASQQVEAG